MAGPNCCTGNVPPPRLAVEWAHDDGRTELFDLGDNAANLEAAKAKQRAEHGGVLRQKRIRQG